jgi:poly-gamma-glutamate capsule biosynthesis protein CapA/YwtB (metallophosphatase superfamily)
MGDDVSCKIQAEEDIAASGDNRLQDVFSRAGIGHAAIGREQSVAVAVIATRKNGLHNQIRAGRSGKLSEQGPHNPLNASSDIFQNDNRHIDEQLA